MSKFNKALTLLLVPFFVVGCSADKSEFQQPVFEDSSGQSVVVDDEGALKISQLQQSYEKAKADGYTGTIEEYNKLVDLVKSDPVAAQQQAEDSGFSGSSVALAALAGMVAGNSIGRSSYANQYGGSSGFAASQNTYRSNYAARPKPTSNVTRTTTTRSTTSVTPRATTTTTAVSRGGFGGSVSGGSSGG